MKLQNQNSSKTHIEEDISTKTSNTHINRGLTAKRLERERDIIKKNENENVKGNELVGMYNKR